jgi:hypothetical protein
MTRFFCVCGERIIHLGDLIDHYPHYQGIMNIIQKPDEEDNAKGK